MRLYLSSFDLGTSPEALVALARGDVRAAVIVNALDNRPEQRAHWLSHQSDALARWGFDVTELDLRRFFAKPETMAAHLKTFGMVWINGGNTFILRRAMRQSGFDAAIASALRRDEIVYAGFSAGAVIAAPSLRGLEIVDDPRDAPAGYDAATPWDGLALIPFSLVVHYRSDHSESEAVEGEVDYYRKHGTAYRTLRDGEAFVVNGADERIVGGVVRG